MSSKTVVTTTNSGLNTQESGAQAANAASASSYPVNSGRGDTPYGVPRSEMFQAAWQMGQNLESILGAGASKKDIQCTLDILCSAYSLKTCSTSAFVGRSPIATAFGPRENTPRGQTQAAGKQPSSSQPGTGKKGKKGKQGAVAPKPPQVATFDKKDPGYLDLKSRIDDLSAQLKDVRLSEAQRADLKAQRLALAKKFKALKKKLQAEKRGEEKEPDPPKEG